MVALLLENKANPNARSNQFTSGATVLLDALGDPYVPSKHQPQVVNMLLKAGADPFVRDDMGRDALAVARKYHYPDTLALKNAALRFRALAR
jgi:ankyrin repeat protein